MGKEAKYVVRLSNEERGQLENLVARGRVAKATRQRAQMLLHADQGQKGPGTVDEAIADLVGVSLSTVHRVRQQFVEEGLEVSLYRKPATNRQYRKLDGRQEAHLVALACSSPPAGRVCWTMQLLADKLVELEIIESIGREAVRTTLKKNVLQPWRKEQWVLPPEQNADFVCAMEDTLEVYQRPYDPQRPIVCFDEQSRQLTKETRQTVPAAPGRLARVDYEYERNGTANLFMVFEPLAGKRRVKVTDRRTALDFAEVIRELVDSYPGAEKIVLVMDNLNTHKLASLYEAFAPDEARRLIERLEVHYTPKHGSWLNMAETELSVMTKQCLRRRIPDKPMLIGEVAAWESSRNTARCRIDWRFTTADARIKLKRLYPSIQVG